MNSSVFIHKLGTMELSSQNLGLNEMLMKCLTMIVTSALDHPLSRVQQCELEGAGSFCKRLSASG